jgi:hypothetical protein
VTILTVLESVHDPPWIGPVGLRAPPSLLV